MSKYSVILPVRNGGHYVKDCVRSILSQTEADLTLHVLDNCSDDGTYEWISSLNDPRIAIDRSETVLSIEDNWKRILSISKNEFMTLIGHDDLFDEDYLAAVDELIKKYPDAHLYQTHFRYIDAKGKLIRHCKPMKEKQPADEFIGGFLSGKIDSMGTGYMMRSTSYDACGGIPSYPNLLFADFVIWIKLVNHGYKATAPDENYSFRLHQSTTAISADIKYHKAFEQFMKFLVSLKKDEPALVPVIEKHALDFIRMYCKGLAHRLLRTPKNKRSGLTVKDFVSMCKRYADQLVPGNDFYPYKQFNIRLAKQIDSNAITRGLFLLFKKIYSKPVYQ